MKKIENRETLKKLICTVTISMAVTGILFIPQIMFSRVKLSKTQENKSVDIAKSDLVSIERDSLSKTSSRNGAEVRDSNDNAEIITEKQEESKNEKSKEDKNATKAAENKKESKETEPKKEVKKEQQETKTKKVVKQETKKKTESNKKLNTEKSKSEKKETKSESKKENKDLKKKEEKDSNKASEQEKNSKNDTKKTTEKKDSSKKETTTKKENKKSTTKTVSISKVKISRNMDLTKRTGLSRKDFIKLMSGVRADTSGFFEKNAGKIYDLCEKYSINEIFFCGLISAESGWNIASNHRRTHNYISLMKNGKLISYGSVNEGLEVAAQKLHYNYLTPGGKFYHGKTLSGVKTCFCPSSSWVGLVYGRMRQIL